MLDLIRIALVHQRIVPAVRLRARDLVAVLVVLQAPGDGVVGAAARVGGADDGVGGRGAGRGADFEVGGDREAEGGDFFVVAGGGLVGVEMGEWRGEVTLRG